MILKKGIIKEVEEEMIKDEIEKKKQKLKVLLQNKKNILISLKLLEKQIQKVLEDD